MNGIRRRDLLRAATLGAPTLLTGLTGAPRSRPNVILILTDDQGFGDLSCHGNPHIRTPNMDRLASEGTEFTRFTVSAVCAPTRASLLTGRYSLRCGVHGVTHGRETMRRTEVTIARALRGAGYRTALLGKWHLGENYPYVPHAMGFDTFIGFRVGHWNRYFDTPVEHNGRPHRLKGYISDALTDEAIRFAAANRGNPFFVYLAYNAPHSPFQVPDRYFDRFRRMGFPPDLASVYGMVENLDDNIGRLLKSLEEMELSEETVVLFLCDNGPQTDRFNARLRGRKGSIYEGGTRSPLFIRWPNKIPAGRKVDKIAAHIDIYPTLLELCAVDPPRGPAVDGRSLAPLLTSSDATVEWPDRIIFSHSNHQPDPTRPFPGAAATQRFKMVNGTELYDLVKDPGETTNIAASHPAELERLNAAYKKWFASVTEGFQRGAPPIPVGYTEENPAVLSAPQATLEGGLRFFQRSGFANDFITGWTGTEGRARWRIDVVHEGRYEVSLEYLCAAADVGARVRVSAGEASVTGEVREPTSMAPNVLPDRAPRKGEAPEMNWDTLSLGVMPLKSGRTELQVEALWVPGNTALDLKSVRLTRL